MAKLSTLSLEELYSRKITASVEAEIIKKEDFSAPSKMWCDKVCTLKCKGPSSSMLHHSHVDVLILQDYRAYDEPKFRRVGKTTETKHLEIIKQIVTRAIGGDVSYKVIDLLKCPIRPQDITKGKPPVERALMKCRPYLQEEIRRINPKVIISLATPATKALGLKASNYGNRGEIHSYNGIPIIFTIHPRILLMLRQNSSGKFWGPDFYSVIYKDFEKARDLLNGSLKIPDLDKALEEVKTRITICRDIETVKKECEKLFNIGMESVLSYDLETNSLDYLATDAKIITAQFGYRDENGVARAVVIPLWHRANDMFNPDEAWENIAAILINTEISKIGHNIKFDILFTYFRTGVRVKGVLFDTMLLLHSINSGIQGNYGLKQAVWDWIPETELGGYEDKLPALTKPPKEVNEETDEENTDGDVSE